MATFILKLFPWLRWGGSCFCCRISRDAVPMVTPSLLLFPWLRSGGSCFRGYIQADMISTAACGQNPFQSGVVSMVTCIFPSLYSIIGRSQEFQMQFPWLHSDIGRCYGYIQSEVVSMVTFGHKLLSGKLSMQSQVQYYI